VQNRLECCAHEKIGFFAFHPAFRALRRKPMESREGNGYSTTIPKHFTVHRTERGIIMNFRKNLEAVFLVAAVVTNFASYAVASAEAPAPVRSAPAAAVVRLAVDQKMPVVVVKAHRLSAAEKAALN
jgi:hypothetical protein